MNNSGILYIVPIPIGNLDDITLRAINVLKTVDYIASEDTRQIGKLISLLELPRKEFISYRDQNHNRSFPLILKLLQEGKSIALTSDRGTPTIADPGYKLVKDLIENNIEIIPLPGPTSIITALSASGLPTDRFTFLGFMPRKKGDQKKIIDKFLESDTTLIMFESPFRVMKLINNLKEIVGEADIVLAKELTKKHEKFVRGKLSNIEERMKGMSTKGEWVVLLRNTKL